MAATNWLVTIRRHGKECKVMTHKGTVAPLLDPTQADTVQWRNRTGQRIVVSIPQPVLSVGTAAIAVQIQEITSSAGPSSLSAVFKVDPTATPQAIPYSIWCDATNDWGVGHSDPEIIIEA